MEGPKTKMKTTPIPDGGPQLVGPRALLSSRIRHQWESSTSWAVLSKGMVVAQAQLPRKGVYVVRSKDEKKGTGMKGLKGGDEEERRGGEDEREVVIKTTTTRSGWGDGGMSEG